MVHNSYTLSYICQCWGYPKLGHGIFLRNVGRLRFKCDGTRTETRFRLSAKRTSPFKSVEASVKSTTGSRGGASTVVMLGTPCSEVV